MSVIFLISPHSDNVATIKPMYLNELTRVSCLFVLSSLFMLKSVVEFVWCEWMVSWKNAGIFGYSISTKKKKSKLQHNTCFCATKTIFSSFFWIRFYVVYMLLSIWSFCVVRVQHSNGVFLIPMSKDSHTSSKTLALRQ